MTFEFILLLMHVKNNHCTDCGLRNLYKTKNITFRGAPGIKIYTFFINKHTIVYDEPFCNFLILIK